MGPPPNKGAGAALNASDREGIHAACRSMTVPWAIEIERAERSNDGGGGGQ